MKGEKCLSEEVVALTATNKLLFHDQSLLVSIGVEHLGKELSLSDLTLELVLTVDKRPFEGNVVELLPPNAEELASVHALFIGRRQTFDGLLTVTSGK